MTPRTRHSGRSLGASPFAGLLTACCLPAVLSTAIVGLCIVFAPFIAALALLGFTCLVIVSMFKE